MNEKIIATLTGSRFETYLKATGFNRERALKLYIWNAKLGASFHIPLQAAEVALRNRINLALIDAFGQDWWKSRDFAALEDKDRERDIDIVLRRIKHMEKRETTEQIVASLSFGFWVGMLHSRYEVPLWNERFRTAFPLMPNNISRNNLFQSVSGIAKFRNRISHHEPLIHSDPTKVHGEIMRLIQWLCPDTHNWVRPLCEAPRLVRNKP